MLRTRLIRATQSFLRAQYVGSVTILAQEDDEEVSPPFAIVRVGSAEDMGQGQANLWDTNLVVAVFHDADETPIEEAEQAAGAVFAAMKDADQVAEHLAAQGVVASCFHPLTVEAGTDGERWFHAGGFRVIAAPAAED